MEFKIYRKSWRRAIKAQVKGCGTTALANSKGMMCCLGQVSVQLGVPYASLVGVKQPSNVKNEYRKLLYPLLANDFGDSELSDEAMTTNDFYKPYVSDEEADKERELKLVHLFKCKGHTLQFIDRVAPKSWGIPNVNKEKVRQ